MLATLAMLFSLSGAAAGATAAENGGEVDVELLLAVDVSRSMDYEEVRMQREGYIAAIQHPDFINAVRGGLLGRIAVSYFEWAGVVDPSSRIDWQTIETAEDAKAFAARLQERPIITNRRTSISAAIEEGAIALLSNGYAGMRRVIDVSGDGANNVGQPVALARDKAVAAGIVINGLAIMLRPSTTVALDQYYADCVIGGPGSFVLPVRRVEDFTTAIRRKLVLEISSLGASSDPIRIDDPQTDCLIGERQWQNLFDR
nr:hypothetical protein RTCK_00865 [Rhizobium sp. TCK]